MHYRRLWSPKTENDTQDCVWRTYTPQLPLWEKSVLDTADRVFDYIPWSCTDGAQLDTIQKLEDLGQEDHIHGWEPTQNDGDDIIGGDPWN